MERKKKLAIGDQTLDVTEVGFRSSGENWNEYLADDGSVIRVKLVVTEIVRVEGQYEADGTPAYVLKSTNVTSVSATDEMKQKGGGA